MSNNHEIKKIIQYCGLNFKIYCSGRCIKPTYLFQRKAHRSSDFNTGSLIGKIPTAFLLKMGIISSSSTSSNSVALVHEQTIPTERLPHSVKLVPNFADRGVSQSVQQIPYSHNLGFLDCNRYFFQVAPQLYSRG
jgi:hypothetical protein